MRISDLEFRRVLFRSDHNERVAAREGGGFTPAFARWQGDVEHMDLVVAGTDAAVGGDHMTAVDPTHAVFGKQRHRTRMDPQAVAPRHVLPPGRPGAVGLARGMRADRKSTRLNSST